MKHFFLAFVLLVLWPQVGLAVAIVDASFRVEGKPLHPGCLFELRTDLADAAPVAVALDVEGCQRSNRFAAPVELEGGAVVWTRGTDRFEYRHLGSLPNRLHVVHTIYHGGGSGSFNSLMFLWAEGDIATVQGRRRARTLLKLVGSHVLGDRFEGKIELLGRAVKVTKSSDGGDKATIIQFD